MARRDAEAELNLPPGFRFHPTDEELVVHYLCRKVAGQRLPVPIIAEIDLYKSDPWDLPEKALFGQREWYFFTPRDRKYPNGSRPNRAAGRGYWKATGADKPVAPKGSGRQVGIKKALVFYAGKAPRGIKTDWIMHEYRLAVEQRASPNKKGNQRLDEWVLCRLYNKKNTWERLQNQKTAVPVPEPIPVTKLVQQDSSFSGPLDSFGESESFHDSEIDNTFPPAFPTNQNQAMRSNNNNYNNYYNDNLEVKVKEDNEWFTDLNLDDLQNPYLQNQEFYNLFSAINSPHVKQNNFMPF
ncbi:hypothetical protein LUZ60_011075 [Juncus effusus]|nr:hypothetical protein LUZ60_011075 [Juncus effusus]